MAAVDLTNPRAKIVRGFAHLKAVEDAIDAFAAVAPDPIIRWEQRTISDENGEWAELACTEVLEEPPLELGLIAGDAIHNFRTTLDHLVCALVEANERSTTHDNQFPIHAETPNAERRRRIEQNLDGMHPDAQERIRNMQPYLDTGAARSRALKALASLDNLDKHRVVMPTVALSENAHIAVEPPPTSPLDYVSFYQRAVLRPGATLVRWNANDPRVEGVTIDVFFATIGFGREAEGITTPGIRHLGQTVFDIVESFDGFARE